MNQPDLGQAIMFSEQMRMMGMPIVNDTHYEIQMQSPFVEAIIAQDENYSLESLLGRKLI